MGESTEAENTVSNDQEQHYLILVTSGLCVSLTCSEYIARMPHRDQVAIPRSLPFRPVWLPHRQPKG